MPNVSLQEPGLTVSYLNQPVALKPPGLAEPFIVVVEEVVSVAAKVVTAGAKATADAHHYLLIAGPISEGASISMCKLDTAHS